MNKVIKKRFKCNLCREKYPITVDMLRNVYHKTAFGDKEFSKAFNCPTCGNIYVNFGYDNKWKHSTWEYFDA